MWRAVLVLINLLIILPHLPGSAVHADAEACALAVNRRGDDAFIAKCAQCLTTVYDDINIQEEYERYQAATGDTVLGADDFADYFCGYTEIGREACLAENDEATCNDLIELGQDNTTACLADIQYFGDLSLIGLSIVNCGNIALRENIVACVNDPTPACIEAAYTGDSDSGDPDPVDTVPPGADHPAVAYCISNASTSASVADTTAQCLDCASRMSTSDLPATIRAITFRTGSAIDVDQQIGAACAREVEGFQECIDNVGDETICEEIAAATIPIMNDCLSNIEIDPDDGLANGLAVIECTDTIRTSILQECSYASSSPGYTTTQCIAQFTDALDDTVSEECHLDLENRIANPTPHIISRDAVQGTTSIINLYNRLLQNCSSCADDHYQEFARQYRLDYCGEITGLIYECLANREIFSDPDDRTWDNCSAYIEEFIAIDEECLVDRFDRDEGVIINRSICREALNASVLSCTELEDRDLCISGLYDSTGAITIDYSDPVSRCRTEDFELCTNCLEAGGTWTSIGCFNTSSTDGIVGSLLRITLGVLGGVFLVMLIVTGYAYQEAIKDGNAETSTKMMARLKIMAGTLVFLVFSGLLLRIIGVNILDVTTSGVLG